MPDIFLVRHGEAAASWGQSRDPGLSELGIQQAERTAQELQNLVGETVKLISSPLARARETARPMAERLFADVEINEAFREIPAPVPLPDRQPWLRQFMRQNWSEQPEELWAWRERAVNQVKQCTDTTLVFTHFLVINAIVGQVLGRDETLCFWPDNASITHLRSRGDALELVALGREMETVVN